MRFCRVDAKRPLKILAKQFASGPRSLFGCVEIMQHDERLIGLRCNAAKFFPERMETLRSASPEGGGNKKTGRKINSPPGLKLGL